MAPLGARAADLVVWWDEGYYAEEDAALREIIAAFEQETGKEVELVQHPGEELPKAIEAALEAGAPPDFAFGYFLDYHIGPWAFDDQGICRTHSLGSRRSYYSWVLLWCQDADGKYRACARHDRSSHDHRHRRQLAPVGPQAPPASLAPSAA